MAFEVYRDLRRIGRGNFSVEASGMCRFNGADLAAIGVKDRVTILVDRAARAFALRAPLDCESGQRIKEANRIWLVGAMRNLAVDPLTVLGWHECRIVEDRLELVFNTKAPVRRRKNKKPARR
jgi:hypothetical protein